MQHPRFRSGNLTTGFIAEEYPDGFSGADASPDLQRQLAGIAGFMACANADRALHVDNQLGDQLDPPANWTVTLGKTSFGVEISEEAVVVDGEALDITLEYTPGDRLVVAEIGGRELAVKVAKTRTGFRLTARGASHLAVCLPAHVAPLADHMIEKVPPDMSRYLLCPMPGLITIVHVAAGERVEAGQPLAIVEAMKMENILRAEKTGVVKIVHATAGESLAVDAIILEME